MADTSNSKGLSLVTATALRAFTITVVTPAGSPTERYTVHAATASHALATYDPGLAGLQPHQVADVARVLANGTIYVAVPDAPDPEIAIRSDRPNDSL